MRILNITQTYSPFFEFGGPPVKVRALSEALARRGHQVSVLTADWGLETRVKKDSWNGIERTPFGWRGEENGVEATYLPIGFRYRALSWNPGVKSFCRARLWNFDVAHIFGLYDLLGPRIAAACRTSSVPYVVEPIGMFLPIVRNFQLKRMYHLTLGHSMLAGSRFVIATSTQEAAELTSRDVAYTGVAPEKIILRRNGVEIPAELPECGRFRAKQGISAESKMVLFLGRLSEKKSPDLLLRAFAMASQSLPEQQLVLVFVGPDEGGMQERLVRQAEELGIGSQVQFGGPIFGEEKWAAYRDADVFVLPSQNENFGNTAAEAAGAGTPVIVTDRCGIAPLLEGAGLVTRHEVTEMSRAIVRVLGEPGLRAQLSSRCRETASRLDWDEPAREMEDLYGRLAGKRSRAASGQH